MIRTKIQVPLDKLLELTALRMVSAHSLAPELFNKLLCVAQLRFHLPLLIQQRVQPPLQAANEVVEDVLGVLLGWQNLLLQ